MILRLAHNAGIDLVRAGRLRVQERREGDAIDECLNESRQIDLLQKTISPLR
jgi:hypothetical protein